MQREILSAGAAGRQSSVARNNHWALAMCLQANQSRFLLKFRRCPYGNEMLASAKPPALGSDQDKASLTNDDRGLTATASPWP